MPNHIPHPSDPNHVLVPHHHGRGFAVIRKADANKSASSSSAKSRSTFGKLKYVGAALLLSCLVALGLATYQARVDLHDLRDRVAHIEKRLDDTNTQLDYTPAP